MYTYQVNFSKRFLDGILKGRLYHDHLRFTCWKDADEFAKKEGQTIKTFNGENYKLEECSLFAIE